MTWKSMRTFFLKYLYIYSLSDLIVWTVSNKLLTCLRRKTRFKCCSDLLKFLWHYYFLFFFSWIWFVEIFHLELIGGLLFSLLLGVSGHCGTTASHNDGDCKNDDREDFHFALCRFELSFVLTKTLFTPIDRISMPFIRNSNNRKLFTYITPSKYFITPFLNVCIL